MALLGHHTPFLGHPVYCKAQTSSPPPQRAFDVYSSLHAECMIAKTIQWRWILWIFYDKRVQLPGLILNMQIQTG